MNPYKASFVVGRDSLLPKDDTQPQNSKVDLVQSNAYTYGLFMNPKTSEIVHRCANSSLIKTCEQWCR